MSCVVRKDFEVLFSSIITGRHKLLHYHKCWQIGLGKRFGMSQSLLAFLLQCKAGSHAGNLEARIVSHPLWSWVPTWHHRCLVFEKSSELVMQQVGPAASWTPFWRESASWESAYRNLLLFNSFSLHLFSWMDDPMCSAYNHRFGVRIMHDYLFQEALNTQWLCHKNASFDHSPNKIFRRWEANQKDRSACLSHPPDHASDHVPHDWNSPSHAEWNPKCWPTGFTPSGPSHLSELIPWLRPSCSVLLGLTGRPAVSPSSETWQVGFSLQFASRLAPCRHTVSAPVPSPGTPPWPPIPKSSGRQTH